MPETTPAQSPEFENLNKTTEISLNSQATNQNRPPQTSSPNHKYSKKILLLALILGSLLAILGITLGIQKYKILKQARKYPLNYELLATAKAYRLASAKDKPEALNQVIEVASDRKQHLLGVIQKNPQEFLNQVLTAEQRSSLPNELIDQGLVEKNINLSGNYLTLVEDHFEKNESTIQHFLEYNAAKETKDYYHLNFTSDIPADLSKNPQLTVKGIALDRELVVSQFQQQPQNEQVLGNTTYTTGTQKIAVIVFYFNNEVEGVPNYDIDLIKNVIFTSENSTSAFYQENSNNKLLFTGDIFGPFELPFGYDELVGLLPYAYAAEEATINSGVDLNQYNYRTFIFPPNPNFGFDATATMYNFPARNWIISRPNEIDSIRKKWAFAHELGHNIGAYEAGSLDCGNLSMGNWNDFWPECIRLKNGDRFDIMGGSGGHRHFNVARKLIFGWLGPEQIPIINESGVYNYNIYTLEEAGSETKGVKINVYHPNSMVNLLYMYDYYLEYRRPVGFDGPHSYSSFNMPEGIQIRLIHRIEGFIGTASSLLVDTDPTVDPLPPDANEPLTDGQNFTDPQNGISITQLSHNDSYATVQITLDNIYPSPSPTPTPQCKEVTPSFSIYPDSQEGQAGDTLIYNLYIKNNDYFCNPRTFFLTGQSPLVNGEKWDIDFFIYGASLYPDGEKRSNFTLNSQEHPKVEMHLTSKPSWPDGNYLHSSELNYGIPGEEVNLIYKITNNLTYIIISEPTPTISPTPTSALSPTPTPAEQPITHLQTVTGGSVKSSAVSTAADVQAGSELLYLASVSSKPDRVISSLSGLGLQWSLVKRQCAGRSQTAVEIWKARGTAAASGKVTATFATAPASAVLAVSSYSGASGIGQIVSANTNGNDGSCSGGTDTNLYFANLTTQQADSLIFAAVSLRNRSHTPGDGFRELAEVHSGSGGDASGIAIQDKPVPSPATFPINGIISNTVDLAVVGVEITE